MQFVNNHIYAGDVEKDIYYQSEESKPEFEESTAERTKMRRQIESDEKKGKDLKCLHQIKRLLDYQLLYHN